jgi:hypothetical protein
MLPVGRFLVNRRLSDVKLLRFDKRLLDISEKLLTAVSGRLGGADDFADRSGGLRVGDMVLYRPEIEPLGVVRALLGNNPNWWAWGCDDMADAERDGRAVGEAPDTEEYAESFPVSGGLSCPCSTLGDCRFDVEANVSSVLLSERFRRCPNMRLVRPESACGVARPRSSSSCQVCW